ncbi:MAG: TIGR04282 family arsenosugar biosynthesis glycosyltransferase [Bacteroidota bacterium]|nr:TIGR04282 family arsenosugar biosynthesis glycosyltransferase [Bacteroidota bacterium]
MTKQALLIFTKNPEAGKVKTRLAATIGNAAALTIYRQLLLHTVTVTNQLLDDKFVFYSNYIEEKDIWDSNAYQKGLQEGNDLGERMNNAFHFVFQKRYNKVVIIGTDCFELNAEIIRNSFTLLNSHDVVIGPAEDGGYYLLGMKQLYSELFNDIQWSTDAVLAQTTNKCAALQLNHCLLPVLKDIDEEKDLQEWIMQKQ